LGSDTLNQLQMMSRKHLEISSLNWREVRLK
jgi:hypothetical protein